MVILARRVVTQTVSKALEKSMVTSPVLRGGLLVIEAFCDSLGDREEGGSAAAARAEAVLGGVGGEVGVEEVEEEPLQDFSSRGEEGDGSVGGAFVDGFAGFGKGDHQCLFPYSGDVSLCYRMVEE